jgi:hypothetical protein
VSVLSENTKKEAYLQTLRQLGVNSPEPIKFELREFLKNTRFSAAC